MALLLSYRYSTKLHPSACRKSPLSQPSASIVTIFTTIVTANTNLNAPTWTNAQTALTCIHECSQSVYHWCQCRLVHKVLGLKQVLMSVLYFPSPCIHIVIQQVYHMHIVSVSCDFRCNWQWCVYYLCDLLIIVSWPAYFPPQGTYSDSGKISKILLFC